MPEGRILKFEENGLKNEYQLDFSHLKIDDKIEVDQWLCQIHNFGDMLDQEA